MLSPDDGRRFIVLDKQCYHAETGLTIENFIF